MQLVRQRTNREDIRVYRPSQDEMLSLGEKIVSIESGTPDKRGPMTGKVRSKVMNWKVPE